MIERLLAAERALEAGDLDRADRLFGQVADADSRNAIAVVGLAEVAHRRGDTGRASELVKRALSIDPDDAVAERLRSVLSGAPAPSAGESEDPVAQSEAVAAEPVAPQRRSLLERLTAWFRRGA